MRLATFASALGWLCLAAGSAGADIDYAREVRPILAENCYACHGPDASHRKGGLRLDSRAAVTRILRTGSAAVVPGNRAQSTLLARLTTPDQHRRMPPVRTGKTLTPAQVEVLGRWIEQGAPWESHWAFRVPRRPPPPAVRDASWPRNAIDRFVLHRLEQEGLRPALEADRATLIRRLSLDLIGLPPTPAEVEAFVSDSRSNAYEALVDRLLASPRYGERMAQQWLDLARYADTNGYRLDNHREVWKYRDWVIQAFNRNLPFDQFTVEQLAGDLLPRPTLDQRIATGFHRNTMVNFGNGSDPREYLAKAVMDRVNTTATVWLGLTLGCAQCHDHKYDPLTARDYYRFYAFFNNVPEKGLDGEKTNPVPSIAVPSPEQTRRLAELQRDLARLDAGQVQERQRLQNVVASLKAAIPTTMVMAERATPRVTHLLRRGDYQDEGAVVTAGVPVCLPALPSDTPANRLGLARWLVSASNPLTSRVTINRLWQGHFGNGLVRTVDDFGTQGELPSHPELLDWLACEFVSNGWDLKAMHKLMVMSATYRQTSRVRPDLLERDPDNRLLARGSRIRLDAETIRDNALAVAGLLQSTLGGPSVRPYQPAGLWEQVAVGGAYSSQTYVQGHGSDLYRRGLYTYWKRSMPYPALVIFDAPTRELCTALRPRTNTPLQALVLLNDPTFVEAARGLAIRMLRETPHTDERLRHGFRLCTGRMPDARDLAILRRVLDQQREHYQADRPAAEALLAVGESPWPAELDAGELAAWTALANMLLNLDETICRE